MYAVVLDGTRLQLVDLVRFGHIRSDSVRFGRIHKYNIRYLWSDLAWLAAAVWALYVLMM